jgi:LysM repeat protein
MWEVSEGETLLFIIQQFGYRDPSIIPEVLALNNLASENAIFSGQQLLIPRQTPTPGPTPEPAQAETDDGATTDGDPPADDQSFAGCSFEERCISADGQYWMHEVQSGETVAGLAFVYDTTVDAIQEDNNVGEFINEGQILQIRIMVTLTPTLTPTGGPDSTATLTPTLAPPDTVAPANGARIARSEDVTLQWAPLRPLQGQQAYRVIVRDASTGEELLREVTRATVLRLPDNLRPGTSREYLWQVVVVAAHDPDADVVGGEGQFRSFTWGG